MRIAFLHPYKMEDHYFVEAIETATIGDLVTDGHEAEAADFLFEPARGEDEQVREMRAALDEAGYDLVFLERPWSDDMVRALDRSRTIAYGRPELVERGLLDVGVASPTRRAVRDLVAAFASGKDPLGIAGMLVRRGTTVQRTPSEEPVSTLRDLQDARFDYGRRRVLSRRSANARRAVVLANLGCAYRNVPNRTGTFDGVDMPESVSTAGCTFCDVIAYEKMTERDAVDLITSQVRAVLRDRPEVTEIAIKDDYAVRYIGALGDALRPLGLGDREVLLSSRSDYLLEFRHEIEEALAGRFPTPIGFYLLGFENFSQAELDRFNKGMSASQIERVLVLMREWTERFPGRFRVTPTGGFILFTPWTTLEDLRINANAIRQHGFERYRGRALLSQLRLYPNLPLYWLAKRDGLLVEEFARPDMSDARRRGYEADMGWRFKDERVAAVHRRLLDAKSVADSDLFDVFEDALDDAAGVARGKRDRPLRMVRAPRDMSRERPATQQILLTRACNQGCAFCNIRGTDARAPRVRAARAIAAVRAAAQKEASTVVLGGAEPLLEWYLPDLVRLARDLGIQGVVLETNATLLGEHGGARALASAGLTGAHVALNSLSSDVSDAITRDRGGHARTIAGISELIDAGIDVDIAFALLPQNRGQLPRLIAGLRSAFPAKLGQPRAVVVRYVHTASAGGVLGVREAAEELLAGARAARAANVTLRPAPGGELPPCLFDDAHEAREVLRLGDVIVARDAHNYDRIHACERCSARGVCPGVAKGLAERVAKLARPLAHEGAAPVLLPESDERARMLLEFRSQFFLRAPSGRVVERRIVRVNFHCNQACDFCFVSRELPAVEHETIVAEIEDAAKHHAVLDLSGGEPTLNPRLIEYISMAKRLGIEQIEVQSNAINMADATYAQKLADAGLRQAFVSLHGVTGAVSDRVTAAPGTFPRTVAGIKNLLRAGIAVRLNFVLCGYNVAELAEFPDFVQREIVSTTPDARVDVNFSFVAASTDNVPRDTRLIPRFSAVAWALEQAHRRAAELGLTLTGFDSKCGVPACYLPAPIRQKHFAADIPAEELDTHNTGFTKSEACARCELDARCYGVRTTYSDLYGTGELRPIIAGEVTAPAESARPDGPPWSTIGLSATSHELRPDSSRLVNDDAAFSRATPAWTDGQSTLDKEHAQLFGGLREVIKTERATASAAEETAAAFRARGLASEVFLGAPGPGVSTPRAIVFTGRSSSAVEEALAIEPHLTAPFHERAPYVRRMGALLGYPDCCVEVFASSDEQDDATHMQRLAREHVGQLAPEQNWAAIPLRPFSHFPCHPGCPATARLGRATLSAIEAHSARFANRLVEALRSVALIQSAERFALLLGARADGPDAFAYDSVLSHRNLGVEDAVLARPAFRAFYLEVVQPLSEGDRVQRLPGELRVDRGGRRIATIAFRGTAPYLLDFTAERARRRLPVSAVAKPS